MLLIYVCSYKHVKIFDRLCCVFGQDIWDALFLCSIADTRVASNKLRLFSHFIAALLYVDILIFLPTLVAQQYLY